MNIMSDISVCIPVGPYPFYKEHLEECIESVRKQTIPAADIILVDDMAGLDPSKYPDCRIWRSPWRIGIPAVANIGYALSHTDLVFQLSCDDRLMPKCLEMCWLEWAKQNNKLGFYWVDIEYSTGEKQALPTGHAMIHQELWRHTGGYPVESGVGACDHIFMNMLLQHPEAGTLYHVVGGPLYWHREWDHQYTRHQNVNPSTIADVRTIFNERWKPPTDWGRYRS
jgi:glycosyltransferase involved in cell wall biosynthesis